MFDEMAKAKDIFWEKFQGTGMSYEIFEVLFDSSIDKLKRNLTSQSSRPDNARELRESEQAMIDKASNWKPEQ